MRFCLAALYICNGGWNLHQIHNKVRNKLGNNTATMIKVGVLLPSTEGGCGN